MENNYWHVDRTEEEKGIIVLKDAVGNCFMYRIHTDSEESILMTIDLVSQLFMIPAEAREQAIKFLNDLLDKFRV